MRELQASAYGFTENDLSRRFYVGDLIAGGDRSQEWRLDALLSFLDSTFCGSVACEFMHIKDGVELQWLRERMSVDILGSGERLSRRRKRSMLVSLAEAQIFEEFCGKRFSGAKRFSLEGCEALIPGLNALLWSAADQGVETVELGMTHRGRLNVLRNSLRIPIEALLLNFEPYLPDNSEYPNNSDDVRYHLGTTQLVKAGTKSIRVSVAANPSHLEAVNAVVMGKTRARQFLQRGDLEGGAWDWDDSPLRKVGSLDYSPGDVAKRKCMGLLIHGDASFYQGSLREALGFSNLRDYSTGGTIHVIINNQIGFTTMPQESYCFVYCSDVAASIGAPIFHVNGDFPEKVVAVFEAAVAYRQRFNKDCVINIWCYRRHGHNEQDRPEITQPEMYALIGKHSTVATLYSQQLMEENLVSPKQFEALKQRIHHFYMKCHAALNTQRNEAANILSVWNEMGTKEDEALERLEELNTADCTAQMCKATGVNMEMLRSYGRAMFALPKDNLFGVHPRVRKLYHDRMLSISKFTDKKTIGWSCAEALAIGSLLVDGYHVRLSGQDVERGTFNQRHAVILDQRSDESNRVVYKPWTALQERAWHDEDIRRELLRHHSKDEMSGVETAEVEHSAISESNKKRLKIVAKTQKIVERIVNVANNNARADPSTVGVWEICNSPLSEEAVLGFEHGYSLYSPTIMTIWEAQFGDFANCAQTIIDTFIASGEEKWVRSSGLVMLLPHGFEGQGPDHSSGRPERFLQLCSQEDTLDPLPSTWNLECATLADVNMHVLMPTSPAQYFHALRRHMLLPFRKPLVIFTPKYLLHHKPCSSSLADMDLGTFFSPVLDDFVKGERKAKRLVICSGKLFYNLVQVRRTHRLEADVGIVRIEQFSPFPFYSFQQLLRSYVDQGVEELVWAQEEPKNMGAWTYIKPRIDHALDMMNVPVQLDVRYVGRPPSASPATGSYELHCDEMGKLLRKILGISGSSTDGCALD